MPIHVILMLLFKIAEGVVENMAEQMDITDMTYNVNFMDDVNVTDNAGVTDKIDLMDNVDVTDDANHTDDEDVIEDTVSEWYVVQTMTGREEVLKKYIEECVSHSVVKECFIPKRERKKKIHGKWKVVTETLFRGYVFIVTDDSVGLFFALKHVPMLSKLLCDGEYTFIKLRDMEVDFISRIGSGRPDHTVKISKVEFGEKNPFNEGDEVVYIEGDLKSFEGQIKRFDKHKRMAVVETEMFGRKTEVWLAFEFLKKKENGDSNS